MKRQLTRCVVLFTLLALLASIAPISWADGPPTDYIHQFQGVAAEDLASEEMPGLVYEAIESALPDVNLSAYRVTATTSILGQEGGYTAETVAVLSNKTAYQTEVVRILATYDLSGGTLKVLESERNYVDPAEAADFGGVAEEDSYRISNAQAVLWVAERRDKTSGPAADAIKNYFTSRGKATDKFKFEAATEARAWNYIKNGSKLKAWWHLAHGLTSNSDGARCYGYAFFNTATDQLRDTEFKALTKYAGLKNTVCYMNGCNTYMKPIRTAVTGGHNVRTYIGGKRLMPFNGTADCDKKFWFYVVKKSWRMDKALIQAQKDWSLVGYYGHWGDGGKLFGATGTGTVHGYVKTTTGKPIKGAKVKVVGYALATTTDATGHYKLTKVPTGTQKIKASKSGYIAQTKKITVKKGTKHRLNFSLKKGTTGAKITVSPKSRCRNTSGTKFAFTGSGFKPGESLQRWFTYPGGTRSLTTISASSTGGFGPRTLNLIGAWAFGTYKYYAKGLTSGRQASVSFTVQNCGNVLSASSEPPTFQEE